MTNTVSPEWASDSRCSVDGRETLTVWTRRASRPVTDRSGDVVDVVDVARHQMLSVWEEDGMAAADRSDERLLIGSLELSVGQAGDLHAAIAQVVLPSPCAED